eukprot:gb/GEZN01009212.1/.p1 GENE.gb/GEZN01009212.1/~~gb/GEZN01009212.1/.p1  ORF type:complete len:434 (-),score=86.69 gb/GEZN01009212.1/:46-1179(-)
MSSLRLGADLVTVFCTSDAAGPIKSYSPELMVHGVLPSLPLVPTLPRPDLLAARAAAVTHITDWLKRLHILVVGPGLGRDEQVLACTAQVITACRKQNLPLVLDADALWLCCQQPSLVSGYSQCVLTPNAMEFRRLWEAVFVDGEQQEEQKLGLPPMDPELEEQYRKLVFGEDGQGSSGFIPTQSSLARHTVALARRLGGVTVLRKGQVDIISDGQVALYCSEGGSPRRCGGQGDVLCGTTGLLLHWAKQQRSGLTTKTQHTASEQQEQDDGADHTGQMQVTEESERASKRQRLASASSSLPSSLPDNLLSPTLFAAHASCLLTRRSQQLAFARQGRSMGATHVLDALPTALTRLTDPADQPQYIGNKRAADNASSL